MNSTVGGPSHGTVIETVRTTMPWVVGCGSRGGGSEALGLRFGGGGRSPGCGRLGV